MLASEPFPSPGRNLLGHSVCHLVLRCWFLFVSKPSSVPVCVCMGRGGSLSPRNHFSESVSRWVFSGFRAPTSILWDASFPRRYSERRRPCHLTPARVPFPTSTCAPTALRLAAAPWMSHASSRTRVVWLGQRWRHGGWLSPNWWVAQRRQAPGGARRPSSATLRTVETRVVAAAVAGRAGRVSLRAGRTDLIGRLSTGQCLDLTGVQGALLFPEQGLPCEHWPCGPWK